MTWIYLSPHLDDAIFSCGGLIWEQAQAGESPQIWTICAGDPPPGELPPFAQSLHTRWGTGPETVAQRRAEDLAACTLLGVEHRWFDVPDCIYRRDPQDDQPMYASGAAIFGSLHPADERLRAQLTEQLADLLPEDARLLAPLTIGNHVDHQLGRLAAETLGRPLYFYADFPYVVNNEHVVGFRLPAGAKGQIYPVSKQGLAAWQQAVAGYASQLETFWRDKAHMEQAVSDYHQRVGGLELWRSAP